MVMVRVGIPHKGGALSFHAFNRAYPAMVSASAFWDAKRERFRYPDATNLDEIDWFLDSAGFTAVQLWQSKGAQRGMASVYPWTYEQYVGLAQISSARHWSAPDLCCEQGVAANPAEVEYRIRATATLLEGVYRVLSCWANELVRQGWREDEVRRYTRPPVPILQGRRPEDYRLSLDMTMEVLDHWADWFGSSELVGIGSMCRRNLHGPDGLFAVLRALDGRLPQGVGAHLFGVKGQALEHLDVFGWVVSTDSMAFDVTARRKALSESRSNTMAHRKSEMDAWMGAAFERVVQAKKQGGLFCG